MLVALVENKPGVLTRVASLFRRRGFNIESLTVGHTDSPEISRMTIVVDANKTDATMVEHNLFKLVNVIDVQDVTRQPAVMRDLALIKVRVNQTDALRDRPAGRHLPGEGRRRLLGLDDPRGDRAGGQDRLDRRDAAAYGIIEMVRTGLVAMVRGSGHFTGFPPERTGDERR